MLLFILMGRALHVEIVRSQSEEWAMRSNGTEGGREGWGV